MSVPKEKKQNRLYKEDRQLFKRQTNLFNDYFHIFDDIINGTTNLYSNDRSY